MFALTTQILVVDHMPVVRKMIGKVCRELGFINITEAGDGVLAWEAITNADTSFGLVLTELEMPNCGGIDLVKRVRSDQRFRKTPFLLVTIETDPNKILAAIKAGMNSYVAKPFTPDLLREKLEEVQHKLPETSSS